MKDKQLLARRHHSALFAVSQALTKGGVTYKEEVWHKECFLCTGCSSPLAGQPFTSQGDSPYCIRCFSSLYAKKCAGCNTAITGQLTPPEVLGEVRGEVFFGAPVSG